MLCVVGCFKVRMEMHSHANCSPERCMVLQHEHTCCAVHRRPCRRCRCCASMRCSHSLWRSQRPHRQPCRSSCRRCITTCWAGGAACKAQPRRWWVSLHARRFRPRQLDQVTGRATHWRLSSQWVLGHCLQALGVPAAAAAAAIACWGGSRHSSGERRPRRRRGGSRQWARFLNCSRWGGAAATAAAAWHMADLMQCSASLVGSMGCLRARLHRRHQ